MTVPLVGLVDTAMLGHLPEIRFLAGVALAGILFDYVYWSFGFLRMGTTGVTAQALGRGDRDEVYHNLYRTLAVALGIAALLLLLQAPIRDAGFALIAGEPGVEAAGRDYFNARIWGAPATLCNFALLGWFLGREESGRALALTLVANLSNIALNYLFIVRMGLAAAGAGLATTLAQYLALVVGMGLVLARANRPAWRHTAVFDRARLRQLFRLNGDILLRTICLMTSFALFLNFSSILGTAVLAANTILYRLLTLAAFLVDGAAFAAESLGGILLGRRDWPALRRLVRLALAAGVGFAALFLAAYFAAPRAILGLLTSHSEVIDLGLRYGPWLAPALLFGSLAYVYDGLFLGWTEGRTLRNAMLLSTLAVFVPAAWIALRLGNNDLLWAALGAFNLARATTLALAARVRLREWGSA